MTTIENATIGDDTVSQTRRDGKRPPWMEKPSTLTQVLKFIVLGVSVALVIIPFWSVIATSLADQQRINESGGGMVMLPGGMAFERTAWISISCLWARICSAVSRRIALGGNTMRAASILRSDLAPSSP